MSDERNDAALVQSAAAGDQTAWDTLVDRYSDLIYANARTAGAEASLAEDIVQVTWMRLLGRLDSLNQPERVRGWLAIVARNATRSELRRSRRKDIGLDAVFGAGSDADTANEAILSQDLHSLKASWSQLTDFCQELLAMRFFDDLSYADVADWLTIPIGTVSKRLRDCLSELRGLVLSHGL